MEEMGKQFVEETRDYNERNGLKGTTDTDKKALRSMLIKLFTVERNNN
jgi:hypothetical protein